MFFFALEFFLSTEGEGSLIYTGRVGPACPKSVLSHGFGAPLGAPPGMEQAASRGHGYVDLDEIVQSRRLDVASAYFQKSNS